VLGAGEGMNGQSAVRPVIDRCASPPYPVVVVRIIERNRALPTERVAEVDRGPRRSLVSDSG
jgi:hypothetical protein